MLSTMLGMAQGMTIAFPAVGAGFVVGLLVAYITKSDGLAVASGFVAMVVVGWLMCRWVKKHS